MEHATHCSKVYSKTPDKHQKEKSMNVCFELRTKANEDVSFISKVTPDDDN